MAGAAWHEVPGTDVHLATALGRRRPVIWVDPPVSILARIRGNISVPMKSEVAPGVTRIHAVAPPGATRPVIRTLSRWWVGLLVRRHLAHNWGGQAAAVVVSSTEPLLAQWRRDDLRRVYFATDDFVAGADLMGLSRRHLAAARESNIAAADAVLAVTESLVADLGRSHRRAEVLLNGCNTELYAEMGSTSRSSEITLTGPIAGVIGQFNARLDLACLEAVADAGIALLLVGPRYDRDADFTCRFDQLIQRTNVQWIDRRPLAELPSFMTAMRVGLTPYANSDFNRASFPLKTLEYLAAGLPVVSTDLPAARILDPQFVTVADSPVAFAAATERLIGESWDPSALDPRRAYAEEHSWSSRAAQLERVIDSD